MTTRAYIRGDGRSSVRLNDLRFSYTNNANSITWTAKQIIVADEMRIKAQSAWICLRKTQHRYL